jgi:hypothetical protein
MRNAHAHDILMGGAIEGLLEDTVESIWGKPHNANEVHHSDFGTHI